LRNILICYKKSLSETFYLCRLLFI
jgi:hypothetical protein